MSYPGLIQSLIIEDESCELYDAIFDTLKKNGEQLATPIHAYGHDAALKELQSDRIIHLVLLDLRLPDISGHPAQEGINHGLELLRQCSTRDLYPIPALLVISGHLEQADQVDLQRTVTNNFYYGSVLVKSPQLQGALTNAINEIKKYSNVGIHIRETAIETYPTLAPRDEDLLRRCVLKLPNCIGVDLKWWSAEYDRATGQLAGYSGWTKTLTGRLLFGGDVSSRLSFFKFGAADGATTVIGNAQMLQYKLAHIKVIGARVSGNRSLLITEKVGSSDQEPISLADYLLHPARETLDSLPGIVTDIADQVRALGDWTEDRRPLRELLWGNHDTALLEEQWQQNGGAEIIATLGTGADPIALHDELSSDAGEITLKRQSFRHGDLNITNVAIDLGNGEASAYIFDASGCSPGPNVRDLATLEVSALLHHPGTRNESLVESCADLYSPSDPPIAELNTDSDLARNTIRLITSLRLKALEQADLFVYKLMVFDNALIQLGGLAFGPSCNKITNAKDAALLVGLTARWLTATNRLNTQL
jgi:CheY-like chemotaxis protein